ncbi:ATP-binding protein [Caenimonas aquaedulcis]|uniref:Signal transduction histidine-protein kinase/phosphatase MprB n=1 Tax=Caenimonas aquaedulcis TaxID=2793270 RepID=A0A931H5R1_9BURK|nr:ATP-binding protein [Caenimonas aquaedulcis]MBG9388943.1 HAMP domain-containing protein [Caenimonas aquaedulcis]
MPPLTLQRKLFLAFAALAAALLLLFAGSSWFGLQRGMGQYVAEIELSRLDWLARGLVEDYARQGSWQFLRDDPEAWREAQMSAFRSFRGAMRPGRGPFRGEGPPPGPPPGEGRLPHGVPPGERPGGLFNRLALFDAAGTTRIAGPGIALDSAVKMTLQHEGRTVGVLALAPLSGMQTDADRAFVEQQSNFVLTAGAVGLSLALLLSWLLARRWLRPLEQLREGAQAIAQGRFDTQLPVQGHDELASLTGSFNDMARQLSAAESSRQRWLSDVAHELRTPLAAMRAEIEALQDGVRTFDDATAQRLHRQVMRLGSLVNDLRLTLDTDYSSPPASRTAVQPVQLLAEALEDMRERFAQAGLRVDAAEVASMAAADGPRVRGDASRLQQVFVNLLENSLRYTGEGGVLQVRVSVDGAGAKREFLFCFDDSAPGPDAQDLPRLFERFYRGEASRSRASGGSGLGLAICKSIVEAHGGSITAQHSALGGLQVCLRLPVEDAA